MKTVSQLKIKIFADGADKAGILEMLNKPFISGFTTNPTLMNKAGIRDYRAFAQDILKEIKGYPISFEVFADDFENMERQALEIASWGQNVYVKIPVMNTKSQPAYDLIKRLTEKGVKLNVTAVMTIEQTQKIVDALKGTTGAIVSIFAGRVADTGRDPVPHMKSAMEIVTKVPKVELLWASPRELLNIFQADEIGCHIITVTNDILRKLDIVGKDLTEYSLDTVKMFFEDATKAGFSL
jgi:transaldolase